jgi:hypothetical protein
MGDRDKFRAVSSPHGAVRAASGTMAPRRRRGWKMEQGMGMTMQAQVQVEWDEVSCDAGCYNTNVFAPDGYKVTCSRCRGRRGNYGNEGEWVECRTCAGTGGVCCPKCHGSGLLTRAKA